MLTKFEIFADVRPDGTLSTGKRSDAHQAIKTFAGKRIKLTIERAYNKRSLNQNDFFHMVIDDYVCPALIDVGWNEARDRKWAKEFVKEKVLMREVVNEKTGEVVSMPRATSGLTTVEFMELIHDLQQWAAEYLSIIIPDPNQQIDAF